MEKKNRNTLLTAGAAVSLAAVGAAAHKNAVLREGPGAGP